MAFHNALRSYHRARLSRVAEHAIRVGRLEQGLPELVQCRVGNAESMAALRLKAHVAYTDVVQVEHRHAVEAALEGNGPDASAFVQRYGFTHRIQVQSVPKLEVQVLEKKFASREAESQSRLCQGRKERVWQHTAGVRVGAHHGPEEARHSEFGAKRQNSAHEGTAALQQRYTDARATLHMKPTSME